MSDLEIGIVQRVGDLEWGRGVELDTGNFAGPLHLFAPTHLLRQIGAHLYGKIMLQVENREVVGISQVYPDKAKP